MASLVVAQVRIVLIGAACTVHGDHNRAFGDIVNLLGEGQQRACSQIKPRVHRSIERLTCRIVGHGDG